MARADDKQAQPPEERASKKLALTTAVLALLAAGFGVLSAYLGVQNAQLGKEQKEAEIAAQSASAAAQSAGAQASELQGQNQQLQEENADLRSQLGAPSASNIPEAVPIERHAGQVTVIRNGPGVDLDAPKSDSQWGTSGGGSATDLEYEVDLLYLGYSGQNMDLGETPASYDSCTSRLAYSYGNSQWFEARSLTAGRYFCVKTDANRYSALKLLRIDDSQATFDVVTYDPPFA